MSNTAKKVLFVDDDLSLYDNASDYLEEKGIASLFANSAEGALEILLSDLDNEIDIVVSDIDMADVSGFELIKRIRAGDRISHLSIVLLSGYGQSRYIARGLTEGASHYITKPFDMPILTAYIVAIRAERSRLLEKGKLII